MNIKHDIRDICQLNVERLVENVLTLGENDWLADSTRQETFHIHRDTQSIRLVENVKPGKEKAKVHPLYAQFKLDISPVLSAIKRNIDQRIHVKKLEKKYGKSCFVRVLLARLNEGAKIPRHKDTGESLAYVHRVHCPLVTNSECEFIVGDTSRYLAVGEIAEINNRRIHAVHNRGAQKRIHLIADYYVPGEKIVDIDGNTHICQL